ncbi:MAG: FAD-dependent oxidoreductase, partial [Saprospiraceae bacterium]
MKKIYDFLLVGRGIAGSLLGRSLRAGGARVGYVDAPGQTAASSVAAGIINPITGRRFVKSWLIDELLPQAAATYREWEEEVGEQLYFERPLYRTLFNRGDENDWLVRAADPAYAAYLGPVSHEPPPGYAGRVLPAYAYGRVLRAAQVRIDRAVELSSRPLVEAGELHHDTFDYELLRISEDGVSYRDLRAGQLIFCEGWRNRSNPWFGHLPVRGNKGQVLLARLASESPGEILKHRVFTVPYADGNCWVGASSENSFA